MKIVNRLVVLSVLFLWCTGLCAMSSAAVSSSPVAAVVLAAEQASTSSTASSGNGTIPAPSPEMLRQQYQALTERCAGLEKTNEALVRENVILRQTRQTNVILSTHVETSPAVLVAQETLFSDNIKQLKEELARAKSLINYLERERLRLKTKVHKLHVWGNQLASALHRARQQLSHVRVQHNNSESKESAASSQTSTIGSSSSLSASSASAPVAAERGLVRRSYLTPPVDADDAYNSDDDKSDDSCLIS